MGGVTTSDNQRIIFKSLLVFYFIINIANITLLVRKTIVLNRRCYCSRISVSRDDEPVNSAQLN